MVTVLLNFSNYKI